MKSPRFMALRSLQRVPIFSGVMAAAMCGLLILEHEEVKMWCRAVFEISVITGGFAIVFLFSRFLHLCRLQRFGIYYTYLTFVCIWLLRYHDGDEQIMEHAIHIAMLVLGMMYVALVVVMRCARGRIR